MECYRCKDESCAKMFGDIEKVIELFWKRCKRLLISKNIYFSSTKIEEFVCRFLYYYLIMGKQIKKFNPEKGSFLAWSNKCFKYWLMNQLRKEKKEPQIIPFTDLAKDEDSDVESLISSKVTDDLEGEIIQEEEEKRFEKKLKLFRTKVDAYLQKLRGAKKFIARVWIQSYLEGEGLPPRRISRIVNKTPNYVSRILTDIKKELEKLWKEVEKEIG